MWACVCKWKWAHCLQLAISLVLIFFYIINDWRPLFPFIPSICSVQKLSEFFSSDEIGEEQEPRAMLSSGSSNHNQNRYQAVVSACAHTFFLCVCLLSTRFFFHTVSPAGASRRSHSALNVVFFLRPIVFLLISPFTLVSLVPALFNRPLVIL